MNEQVKKIHQLIYNQEYKEAEKLLKSYIEIEKLSSPQYIEDVFTIHIHTVPIIRNFLKYLDISKVPPSPIDTQYDIGRRFFYTLYILNRTGGMRLVGPYLDNIITNRAIEKRFLAGMYFLQINYQKAAPIYQDAANMIKDTPFSEVEHALIYGNLGACLLYSEDYEQYHQTKLFSLNASKNHEAIRRIYSKYDILYCAQIGDIKGTKQAIIEADKNRYIKKSIGPNESHFFETIISVVNNNQQKIESNIEKLRNWHGDKIRNGTRTPERLIATIIYLKKIAEIFNVHVDAFKDSTMANYPMYPFKVLGEKFDDSRFTQMGESSSTNYINFETEEYHINGHTGIGLSNEIKAIYFLTRSENTGITFETLASLIYDHSDYAGLFRVKERIKQIIHRIRNHYQIDIKAKFYRAYMDKKDIDNIYIQKTGRMKIENHFSMASFESFYKISTSKAKKILKELLDKQIIEKKIVGKKNIYSFKN